MKVKLLNYAQPEMSNEDVTYEHLVKQAAAICVDKLDNPSDKGMNTAINSGHFSILEHLPLTFLIEDISRACSHQLVRHRIASYSQMSQRYAKVDTNEEWYVKPESIKKDTGNFDTSYDCLMRDVSILYNNMCKAGIPNEDARMILPNACFTSTIVSMNARAFIEASTLRTCNKAQWEIKELFKLMRESIKDIYPTVYKLAVPNCYKKQGCTEVNMCKSPKSL